MDIDPRKDKRTTVSLAHVVWDMAEEMMISKGFNDNFSAYVADLIRRDRERVGSGLAEGANSGPLAAVEKKIVSYAKDAAARKPKKAHK